MQTRWVPAIARNVLPLVSTLHRTLRRNWSIYFDFKCCRVTTVLMVLLGLDSVVKCRLGLRDPEKSWTRIMRRGNCRVNDAVHVPVILLSRLLLITSGTLMLPGQRVSSMLVKVLTCRGSKSVLAGPRVCGRSRTTSIRRLLRGIVRCRDLSTASVWLSVLGSTLNLLTGMLNVTVLRVLTTLRTSGHLGVLATIKLFGRIKVPTARVKLLFVLDVTATVLGLHG